jgi:8-oxo-dGTP pyrophosphatase MutT (NUDIX family)
MAAAVSAMVQVHVARANGKSVEFLLLKRSVSQHFYPGIWQVITGKKKAGETFVQCALREIMEETGCVPADMWALPFVATFFLQETDSVHHSPVFGAIIPFKTEIFLSAEHAEYGWFSAEESLQKLVMPSHREGTEVFLKEVLLKENRELFKIRGF